jgi:hypothetical protein
MHADNPVISLVETIDQRGKAVLLAGGGNKELLSSFHNILGDVFKVMEASTQEEINGYCQKYDGFYTYAYMLQQLTKAIDDGAISMPE